MVHALALSRSASTDNPLLALPDQLEPSYQGALSSVRLVQFFKVREPPEWVDDAPMSLPSRGRVRVEVISVRRLEFSAVGDEFEADDD